MEYKLFITAILFTYIYLINFFSKKYDIFIDKSSVTEKHKLLLTQKNDQTPLSGFFYFIPLVFIILFKEDLITFIVCLAFFVLGFMSDIKVAKSPKLRFLIQFILLAIYLHFNSHLIIDTRIDILNELMNNNIFRIFFASFFFLVLINGYNFIDGVNNLSSLNFLIVIFFLCLLSNDLKLEFYNSKIELLIISLVVFVFFNFFGKNYLGDGAVYGLSFLIGYMALNLSLLEDKISPYFIANLLWYPAFENFFSIIRRSFYKKKNYLPDNYHLHQMIYKYLKDKNFIKKSFLLSSVSGILINSYLFIISLVAYNFYSHSDTQITLLFINMFLYIFVYRSLIGYSK
tara:strand:+ start:1220 stop:2251 length:1032 start_codon:yes stop_codon:yes gene_type:complete